MEEKLLRIAGVIRAGRSKEERQKLLMSIYDGIKVYEYDVEIHLEDMKAEVLILELREKVIVEYYHQWEVSSRSWECGREDMERCRETCVDGGQCKADDDLFNCSNGIVSEKSQLSLPPARVIIIRFAIAARDHSYSFVSTLVASFKYVIKSFRSFSFLRPPNAIFVPGIYFFGFSRYVYKVSSTLNSIRIFSK